MPKNNAIKSPVAVILQAHIARSPARPPLSPLTPSPQNYTTPSPRQLSIVLRGDPSILYYPHITLICVCVCARASVSRPAFNRLRAYIFMIIALGRGERRYRGGKRAFQKGDIRFHKYFLITFIKVGAPSLWPRDPLSPLTKAR